MSQPIWKFVGNIGDKSPLDHGGFFIYVDETGVYPPEAEVVELDDESDDPHYTVYRFPLERCTYIDGILSDNPHRPDYPAWFAFPDVSSDLSDVCKSMDISLDDLVKLLCSDDPKQLALGYNLIGQYHGLINFDDQPMKCRRRELHKRYLQQNGEDYGKRA